MARIAFWLVVLGGLGLAGLWTTRARHERQTGQIWRSLDLEPEPEAFAPEMLEGLPTLAQRYLSHAIAVGTPLARRVHLRLFGTIRLSADGDATPMESEEILSPPLGFVWRARVGAGAVRIRGYDRYYEGSGEMRWWLWGLVPVATAIGDDVSRSASGRMLGESVLIPTSLLPSRGAEWEPVDGSTVRVRLSDLVESVELTLTIHESGRLERVSFPRWNSDANNGPIGVLEFVMIAADRERTFGGITLPERFEAGWASADGSTTPFFSAEIRSAAFR